MEFIWVPYIFAVKGWFLELYFPLKTADLSAIDVSCALYVQTSELQATIKQHCHTYQGKVQWSEGL